MRFLAVEGVTGREAAIGRGLAAALKESGVPDDAIRLDDANTRIPLPTETGNLIVDLPGRGAMHNQRRIMFMTQRRKESPLSRSSSLPRVGRHFRDTKPDISQAAKIVAIDAKPTSSTLGRQPYPIP
jgi:hypothetical protein